MDKNTGYHSCVTNFARPTYRIESHQDRLREKAAIYHHKCMWNEYSPWCYWGFKIGSWIRHLNDLELWNTDSRDYTWRNTQTWPEWETDAERIYSETKRRGCEK